jgi:hypothetical protein
MSAVLIRTNQATAAEERRTFRPAPSSLVRIASSINVRPDLIRVPWSLRSSRVAPQRITSLRRTRYGTQRDSKRSRQPPCAFQISEALIPSSVPHPVGSPIHFYLACLTNRSPSERTVTSIPAQLLFYVSLAGGTERQPFHSRHHPQKRLT